MATDPRFATMFEGPSPTARRIDGIRDARSGKPKLSSDRDYLSGYDAGTTYGPGDAGRARDGRTRGPHEQR
ncbi:hypothetical protein HNR51_003694 [Methylorubrum thiocyanatum]|uniref:Uncharacterized protein n=1 Tax=Methylorubrum thiocyanatum TaxID=47958 RepID=A0AA40S4U6_9HYPH|nr:hypothetical protein [Methylorubrum thiocyanatum]GJE81986.1 hypothetical protein CJNNKLLH_3343 [Methylorubrum thiocyanatum]